MNSFFSRLLHFLACMLLLVSSAQAQTGPFDPRDIEERDEAVLTVDVCKKIGCFNTECVPQITPDPLMLGQCEWVEDYACATSFGNCGMNEKGECGWLPNPEYDSCTQKIRKTHDREHIHKLRRKHYEDKK